VKLRIVVLGYVVRGPIGGMAWHHLQYVLGLVRLGHDAWFVEDSDDYPGCYDPARHVVDADPTYGLAFAARAFRRLGLTERWAYHDAHGGGWMGPAADRAPEVCRSADLVLNLSGVNPLRPWLAEVPRRALVDTDPVFTQLRHLHDAGARAGAALHTHFFSFGEGIARVIELPTNMGKAAALSAGCAEASNDVLVFADARQTWAPEALGHLLENFDDPSVGGAGGDLVVEEAPGVMAGVGLYWRYEKWLRRTESRLHSSVGLTGAICSVRRELFRPIPPGTILDDVYWPLRVVMQGHRVVHDDRARAYDRLPDRARDEFRRKVRTLSGNFQLIARLPSVLLPWRNPIWWQFASHKPARLLVPWALLGALGLAAALGGPLYRSLFLVQVACYLVGLAGAIGLGTRSRVVSAASSFLVLNAAAWMAFWVWLTGRSARSWGKVAYRAPVACPREDA